MDYLVQVESVFKIIEDRIFELNKQLSDELKNIEKNPTQYNHNASLLKHTIYELVFVMNQVKAFVDEKEKMN